MCTKLIEAQQQEIIRQMSELLALYRNPIILLKPSGEVEVQHTWRDEKALELYHQLEEHLRYLTDTIQKYRQTLLKEYAVLEEK